MVGEPGIGKTRLLAALADRVSERGLLVLWGRALEFERDLPFGVWIDALDEYLRSLEDEPDGALGGHEVVDDLAAVLPSLRRRAGGRDAAPILDERHLIHSSMRALLGRLAGQRGLVLVLDDMHWADESSIDLTGALLRRPPTAELLIALALRPHRAPPRLAAALERAERDGGLSRVELAPLDREASDRLLGAGIPEEQRARLHAESGGNPFYLQHLARWHGAGAVPRGVSEAIAEELRAIPPDARRVLEAAAVVGDPFEPDMVAAAAGTAEPAVLEALDVLIRLDLVRATTVPRRFGMRHPLVRRAVYETAGGGWRLAAHARIAEALRARGAPPELRAHHVARSARPGDEEAIGLLADAARRVLDSAPATAAEWLRSAARLEAELEPEPSRRIALLEPMGRALVATGRLEEGHDALAEAADLIPMAEPAQRARLAARCASVEHRLGRNEQAQARLALAMDELPPGPSPERLSLLLELAADGFYRGDFQALADNAARTLDLARALDDRAHVMGALAATAMGDTMTGRVAAAALACDAAAAAFDALPDEELARRLDGAHFLTLAEMYLERMRDCAAHATRAIEVARSTRQGELIPVLSLAQGFSLAMLGRLAEARRVLESAVEAARLTDNPFAIAWVLVNASLVARLSGDVAIAMGEAEESVELVRGVDVGVVSSYTTSELAESVLAAGNPRRAVELLLGGCGGPEITMIVGFWRCQILGVLTHAQLECGKVDEAERAAALAAALAQELGLGMARGWGRLALAEVALHRGEARVAADLAQAASTDMAEAGAPIEEARSRVLAGRALGAAGRRDEAVGELRIAAELAERAEARGIGAVAARELRRLGRRPTRGRADAEGLDALSGREREIADLVCDGRTNAEIAAALYLSKKTVETHIRNIFGKLQVSSRLEIARLVERQRMSEVPRAPEAS